MRSNLALKVSGLSKAYTIRHERRESTLAETLLLRIQNGFRAADTECFWALNDIDFEIEKGDVVGIIGRNGAGKSTLLKVLSRITHPTRGRVELYGRVGSLLEVGTGFHPELTGRENIFLNGAILGMTRDEIRAEFDAIVDFSGVAQFLDTPVKRYSSGMYVRLAFAVAAHLRSEILIVDEVLAVGDAEFQRRCLGKMKDVSSSGRTVLFVSHHMQSVKVLCSKGLYLERGRASQVGPVDCAIADYIASFSRPSQASHQPDHRPGTGELRFSNVTPLKQTYTCAEEKVIEFRVIKRRPYAGKVFVSAHIVSDSGTIVAQCDSRMVGHWIDIAQEHVGRFAFRTPWLKPGEYRIEMFICNNGVIDRHDDACRLHVIALLPYPAAGNSEATQAGVVFSDYSYSQLE